MPIFFTLSGFIIHYVYADQFANRQSTAIPNFAESRFSRIYPLNGIVVPDVWQVLSPVLSETATRLSK